MPRLTSRTLLIGGLAFWAALTISCTLTERTILVPPFIEGATLVGSSTCAKCHGNITGGFHDATHAHLTLKDEQGKTKNVACESCHGPASLHVKAGTRATIINPRI